MPEGQTRIMDFGMFELVSRYLLKAMNWLHSIFFNSYAWAIIILTLIIKSALWPLQNKSTQSMKRMQLLQPKMTELREKYKDDPARMNTEVMKLYKDYGVNPLSGCLPMLIQIPIFFGFFNMLGKAVELRGSTFLWVKDLSMPDELFHIPGLGWPVNLLPIIMAVTMLWQMSLSPKSGDPMQQRIFMFMPIIFIAFCYNYASALALYWTVQNLFSVVQLYLTRNQAPPTLQKVAAPAKKK
jgi:YidC/Oxa1 family membrane protein insertase